MFVFLVWLVQLDSISICVPSQRQAQLSPNVTDNWKQFFSVFLPFSYADALSGQYLMQTTCTSTMHWSRFQFRGLQPLQCNLATPLLSVAALLDSRQQPQSFGHLRTEDGSTIERKVCPVLECYCIRVFLNLANRVQFWVWWRLHIICRSGYLVGVCLPCGGSGNSS